MPYNDRKRAGGRLHQDWKQWPRAAKERLYTQFLEDEALERARDLESQGWRVWYSEIFGPEFVANLAPFHIEAIEWHWNATILRRAGLRVEKSAYPAIWSRGFRKSNIIRAIVVCDACLSNEGYCLYVSGTKAKVRGHAISLESIISSPKVREYYPKLSQVKRNLTGAQKSWTADLMYAESGHVFHFIGLSEGVAGANIDNVRPTIIVCDDVDDREDSPLISAQRLKVLTRSVLPTRQANTLIFLAQNYISRHGVIYQIHTGKEIALTNRVNTEAIPAVRNLITEQRTIDGIVHDVVVSGEPTWPWYDLQRVQDEIDTIGLDAFLVECQHAVDQDRAGVILTQYNETVHVIKRSEVCRAFGLSTYEIPDHWHQYVGFDWGTTTGHDCVILFFAVSAMNSALPGITLLHKCMTFPQSTLAGTVAHRLLNYVLRKTQADPRKYIELGLLDRATGDPGDALAIGARKRVVEELAALTNYRMWHMSHEAKAVRDIFRVIYGLGFQACNPKRAGGVPQIEQHLRVDMSEDHPFRLGAKGLSRMYIVVDDAEYEAPKTDDGMALVRYEFPEWRWRAPVLTTAGYLDERPLKQFDNCGNAAMMVFTHFGMQSHPLNYSERVEAAIPKDFRYAELLKNSPFEAGLTPEQEMAHLIAIRDARRKVRPSIERFDEYGEKVI